MTSSWLVPDWPAPPNVRAAVTTRDTPGVSKPPYQHCNLGLRSGDDSAAVRANRAALVSLLDLPAEPHWLHQVHGTTAVDADMAATDAEPQADAAVTHRAGTVLAIQTADCLPVLFAAADGSAVAAAHAGWRGLSGGVLEATLHALALPPSQVIAWLGPCIGALSYEVGEDVHAAFTDADPGAESAFAPTRRGHWTCDLALLARRRLKHAGIAAAHGGGFDTRADRRFYSWRRDGAKSGRFATLVWLAPAAD
jgi:YfiH family protein